MLLQREGLPPRKIEEEPDEIARDEERGGRNVSRDLQQPGLALKTRR